MAQQVSAAAPKLACQRLIPWVRLKEPIPYKMPSDLCLWTKARVLPFPSK